ncbi:MAG TPA: hypothetical protein VMU59_14430 [Caulobacteraceae bacterium]|nr:hypothetical protein [Caulobacteraceae bacterium]
MSGARFHSPTNHLGKAVTQPGGKPVATALADAQSQLDDAAEQLAGRIDEILGEIGALCARPGGPPPDDLYRLAREAAGLAALAHLPDLGLAAHALCSLIDLSRRAGALPEEQIQVGVGAMRLLRHPERFSEEARKMLLDDLKAVLAKALKTASA